MNEISSNNTNNKIPVIIRVLFQLLSSNSQQHFYQNYYNIAQIIRLISVKKTNNYSTTWSLLCRRKKKKKEKSSYSPNDVTSLSPEKIYGSSSRRLKTLVTNSLRRAAAYNALASLINIVSTPLAVLTTICIHRARGYFRANVAAKIRGGLTTEHRYQALL